MFYHVQKLQCSVKYATTKVYWKIITLLLINDKLYFIGFIIIVI